jgi:hypothetical protein
MDVWDFIELNKITFKHNVLSNEWYNKAMQQWNQRKGEQK